MALTHAEVVRRDGCWQSDGLADLDALARVLLLLVVGVFGGHSCIWW